MINTQQIRILNLFTIMNRGGAETMVMNYYRNLDRNKVQFDFMVHRYQRGTYDDEIEALGGKIYRLDPIRPWNSAHYMKAVDQFYKNHNEYKIIHSHMSELGYYDFLMAERNKVPVRICHAHSRPYGYDLKSPVRWYYKKKMMPHITDLFVCGEEAGEWLYGKKNRDRFVQMNNAIDAKRYESNPIQRVKTREEFGIRDSQMVVGHVGRFETVKNHSFLVDVFSAIHKIKEDAILLLIGNDQGQVADEIHNKVVDLGLEDNVKFLGSRSDVPDLLQAMDIFVFPSLYEGVSVALMEAQASGVQILISDGIPRECIKTELITVKSLEDSAEEWAMEAIRKASIDHINTYEIIQSAGYDVVKNAKWLQDYYIDAYNREFAVD